MQVRLVDNIGTKVVDELNAIVGRSRDIRFAVAFMSSDGLALVRDALREAVRKGATFEVLVGLDMSVTEPAALSTMYEWSQANANVAMFCIVSAVGSAVYHPKLYLAGSDAGTTCVVGSSNLTAGGLKKNIEANLVVEGEPTDDVMTEAYSVYNRLKFHKDRVVPDAELLQMYADRFESAAAERKRRRDKQFEEKVRSLRRPTPTRRDLVGWLELVYDALPKGEFTTSAAYEHEEEFSKRFPANTEIRAKVRQQLQLLRDMGLIEHLGRGRWRKPQGA